MEAVPMPAAGHAAEASDDAEALALRARENPSAFAELYVRHREAVYRYLRARCASDDEALELTAVTFERAFAAMPRYRTRGGGVLAWLFRIARNGVIDQERRRRPMVPDARLADESLSGPSPEDQALAAEQRHRLRQFLADLTEVQRDAIALRYGGGLSAGQIGLLIGKSEEATQKLISRAVARLREDFDEQ